MVAKTRPTAEQLARVKAQAQASAVAEGRDHVLKEDAEHQQLRAQVVITAKANAKA